MSFVVAVNRRGFGVVGNMVLFRLVGIVCNVGLFRSWSCGITGHFQRVGVGLGRSMDRGEEGLS